MRSTRTPVSFISIKTQFENVGDALITRELIRIVAQRGEVVADVSRCPPEFRMTLGLENIENVRVFRRLGFPRLLLRAASVRLANRRCFYFLVPGGIGREKGYGQALRYAVYTLLLMLLRAVGVRVCHLGMSYEKLGARHMKLLRSRARALYVHAVRDEYSAALLRKSGVRVDAVVPDFAMNLPPFPMDGVIERNAIAVSFRTDKYPSRRGEIESFVEHLVRTNARLRDTPLCIKFVAQVRRDNRFMEEQWRKFKNVEGIRAEYYKCDHSIEMCRAVYADCENVYSNRLHALLMALSVGATPIAVIDEEEDKKVLGLFETLGLKDCISLLGGDVPIVNRTRVNAEILVKAKQELNTFFDNLMLVDAAAQAETKGAGDRGIIFRRAVQR